MKNYLLFSFLKYKNRSSSSSIATKKKKKKRKQLFSLKNLSFFSKKLRHLYESIPPFCFLLRRSVSFLHRRAHAPWYVSLWLRSFVWADVSFSYSVCVCVYLSIYMLSRLQLIKYLFCHRSSVCFFPSVTFSCDLTSCLIVFLSVIQTQIFLLS